jgi:hypothetical protein
MPIGKSKHDGKTVPQQQAVKRGERTFLLCGKEDISI